MCRSPAAAMATNQITMTGAKKLATRAVPRLCPANKPSRMAMVSGTTECSNAGVTSVKHSTADNTEIAGVITASPRNMEAPTTPSRNTSGARRPNARVASAVKDGVPPSPLFVGPQQQKHVFDRHHDDQRPKDQREHAEHDVACDRPGFDRRNHRHAKRIKRARADVAIDDADAAESQRPQVRFVLKYAIGNRRGRPGPGVFVRYLGHGGRVSPDAAQKERRLISPLIRRQHAPARQVPRARGAFPHDRPDVITP